MRFAFALMLALLLCRSVPAVAAVATDATIPSYHGEPSRSGAYIVPGLSWAAAPDMRRDQGFDGRVEGHVYAQPLYWRPAGAAHGLLIVVTESDVVSALDAETGRTVWHTSLGDPVSRAAMPCGDINPLGITGTPVIDPAAGAIYLDAMVSRGGTPEHLVFGARLTDGAVLRGWPIDVQQAMQTRGLAFSSRVQGQRSALAMLDGRVFIAFGGNFGDCGDYHGMVLGLATDPPRAVAAWSTSGLKGGIWAPGGISSDGRALFVTTGNTAGAHQWAGGEGAFRLGPGLVHSASPRDWFAPANWKALDESDLDLAGVNPMPIDLPGGARRLLTLGKDGIAYLLDRDALGGIGGQLAMRRAAAGVIITGPAFYPWQGRVLVAYQARRVACPDGRERDGVAALAVGPDVLEPAWCAPFDGRGSPIVTTTDGQAEPIVWVAGAEGDDRLHAFRGDTGRAIWTSPETLAGLRHFVTILPAEGRLYIAGDGRVYSFRTR